MEKVKIRADEIRRQRGMTVTGLAKAIGTTRVSAHRLLSGETWPTPKNFAALAAALGVAPWELIEGAPSRVADEKIAA